MLGRLLFLIYIKEMSTAVKNKLSLYADDSGIFASGQSKSVAESALNEDL